jgi:3-deoxy-alpha-D-manno-octulosonate 8-oxidase
MTVQQNVSIPAEVCSSLTDKQHDDLFDAMIVHEKPLTNALGVKFKEILTRDKARELFETM